MIKNFLIIPLFGVFVLGVTSCATGTSTDEPEDTGTGEPVPVDTGEPDTGPPLEDTETGEPDTGLDPFFLCDVPEDPCCVDGVWECYKDERTGLFWQKEFVDGHWITHGVDEDPYFPPSMYSTAADYCAELTLGGFDDWELPSIDHLRSLVFECDQFADCDVTQNDCLGVTGGLLGDLCVLDQDCNCFDSADCKESRGYTNTCFQRLWYYCYLPDGLAHTCNLHGSNFEVWSNTEAWNCMDPPTCAEVDTDETGQVWAMDFNTAMPYPRTDHYVFHPVYPPTPNKTICMRGTPCIPFCGANEECVADSCECAEGFARDTDGFCN